MRSLLILAAVMPVLFVGCGEDKDDESNDDLEVVYEILGTKADGDGIPVWFELQNYGMFKDPLLEETKTAAGVLEKKITYEYSKLHVETSQKEYRSDGTLAEQVTTTYVDDDHLAQRKRETFKEDGKTVESTETDVYEYVPGSTKVAKSTETIVGGKSSGEITTNTNTYDGEGRLSQEVRDYPDRTYTTTYDYATNTVTEKTLDKESSATSETVSTYRGLSQGAGYVLLSEKKTGDDGAVVTLTNTCTDFGRRVDCKGSYVSAADGATVGSVETSLFLQKATRGNETFIFDQTLKSKETRTQDGFTDVNEETDGPNAAGVRERVRTSSFASETLPTNVYKYVTTFDDTNFNHVRHERFKNDVLESIETINY